MVNDYKCTYIEVCEYLRTDHVSIIAKLDDHACPHELCHLQINYIKLKRNYQPKIINLIPSKTSFSLNS